MQGFCAALLPCPVTQHHHWLARHSPKWVRDHMSQEQGDRASIDQSRGSPSRSQLGSEPQAVSSQQAAGPATPGQTELLGTTATHEAGVEAETDTDTQIERGRLLDIHGHPSPRGGAKLPLAAGAQLESLAKPQTLLSLLIANARMQGRLASVSPAGASRPLRPACPAGAPPPWLTPPISGRSPWSTTPAPASPLGNAHAMHRREPTAALPPSHALMPVRAIPSTRQAVGWAERAREAMRSGLVKAADYPPQTETVQAQHVSSR